MIKLYDASLFDVLPNNFRNAETEALNISLRQQIQKIIKYAEKARLWSRVQDLDSDEINILAHDLNTPYFDESLPIETRRNLLMSTFELYANMGTPASVEKLIDIIFGNGQLKEWFEYGGNPYFFKVITENEATINAKADEFLRMLNSVKRLAAHLEAIEVIANGEMRIISPLISGEYDFKQYVINMRGGDI